jgi:predicted ester cyclase
VGLCRLPVEFQDQSYAPDYVGHAPPFPDIVGLQAAKGFALAYRQAFPDLQTATEDMIAEGDKVVVRWTTSGTHLSETEAFGPPTGKPDGDNGHHHTAL